MSHGNDGQVANVNPDGTASAPATTANLGPAFDVIALAIALRCQVKAVLSEEWSIDHLGEYQPQQGEGDGVLASARQAVGDRPLALTVETEIPIGRGLGSSAAAYVAGAAAALRAVGDEAAPDRVFRIAAELEGHDDQVGAAVYGGLVLVPAEGMPMRMPLHPSLRAVIAIPESKLPTPEARAVVPPVHPHDVVLRSLARVSALTTGLITGDAEMLSAAHGDEIHESHRAHLSPESEALKDLARRAGAFHAARSGSGPSVVAIVAVDQADRVANTLREAGAIVINEPMDTVGLI